MSAREDGERIGANKHINMDQVVSVCGPLLGILKCGWIQAFSICSLSIIFKFLKKLNNCSSRRIFLFVIDYHYLLRINDKHPRSYWSVYEQLLVVMSPIFSLLGKFKNGSIKILLHLLANIVTSEVINNNNNGFRGSFHWQTYRCGQILLTVKLLYQYKQAHFFFFDRQN